MSNLPRYRCHKEVNALKIAALQYNPDGSLTITPERKEFPPFNVEATHVPLHDPARPQIGWYWVRYENGYESFSPPKEFEDGYTLLREPFVPPSTIGNTGICAVEVPAEPAKGSQGAPHP